MFLIDGQLDASCKGIQPLCHGLNNLKLPQSSDGALLIPCNIQQKGEWLLGHCSSETPEQRLKVQMRNSQKNLLKQLSPQVLRMTVSLRVLCG